MAIAEQQPEIPPDQKIQEIPDVPEMPPHIEEGGVKPVPVNAQPLKDDRGTTVVQPVPVPQNPSGPSITIPAQSQTSLTQMAKGDAANSQTWFGVYWLYKIKKALKDGLHIVFGGEK